MAGEIFIARQDTLEEVKQTVNEIDTNVDTVNNTTSETKTQTTGIKADTDGLKLSTDSIKQIADTILERIGLTTDVGGANTGTVNGKLNALFSAGGGISGFRLKTLNDDTTYTTKSSGIVLANMTGNGRPDITKNGCLMLFYSSGSGSISSKRYLGLFTKGAIIYGRSDAEMYIFEFI